MGTLHHAVSVRDFSSKTTYLWKKIDSYYFVRTLSGHTWFTAEKFLIMNLSSLHPYGKPYLGYTTRLRFMLLGDSSCCSATAHNCSVWQNLLIIGPTCTYHCPTMFDIYAYVPGNLKRLSGVLGEPRIIHDFRAESCPARLYLVGWAAPGGATHVVCRGYPGSYPP